MFLLCPIKNFAIFFCNFLGSKPNKKFRISSFLKMTEEETRQRECGMKAYFILTDFTPSSS